MRSGSCGDGEGMKWLYTIYMVEVLLPNGNIPNFGEIHFGVLFENEPTFEYSSGEDERTNEERGEATGAGCGVSQRREDPAKKFGMLLTAVTRTSHSTQSRRK